MTDETTTINTEVRPSGLTVITVKGDLDSLGTHTVEEDFTRAITDRSSRVLVDLAHVNFISSAGLALLLVKGKTLRQGGGNLFIAGAQSRVMEVLSMAGFDELFDLYATTAEAFAQLESKTG